MRYLSLIAPANLAFLCAATWGAAGLPLGWPIVSAAFAAISAFALGIVLGGYMSRALERNLLFGEIHFLVKPVPGGVWFFIVLGVFCAMPVLMIQASVDPGTGWLILHIATIVGGILLCTTFSTIALSVWHLERAEGKHVWLSPGGFFFDGGSAGKTKDT